MKTVIKLYITTNHFMKSLLLILLIPLGAMTQYPGYFYTFRLTDADGKMITLKDSDYKMKVLIPLNSKVLLAIDACRDDTTMLHFYKGYTNLDRIHQLQITKMNSHPKERMIIKFPSSLSTSKEPFYHNLYAGNLIFGKGVYIIKLPSTSKGWDELTIKHLCPDYGGVDKYYDISSLQDNK